MFTAVSIELIENRVRASVSPKRFVHSIGTARLAREMAKRWDLPGDKAYLAGIAHDVCKELPPDRILELALRDSSPVPPWFDSRPKLLHGRAAAVVLREEFDLDDADILEAVREHTFGSPTMGPLARILYCADKIEPSRFHVTEEFRRECLRGTIDEMLIGVVRNNIDFLTREKKDIAEPTLALYSALTRRNE
jgi:nicotinate-nucleotide adenylyltransferase